MRRRSIVSRGNHLEDIGTTTRGSSAVLCFYICSTRMQAPIHEEVKGGAGCDEIFLQPQRVCGGRAGEGE
ncbi:hypothetical protein VZT92_018033 [Zoarces viviparus]|uniref:Uncharacterized protein n=1 Tax=Zoarces viviparus TaxID=48416 RepID=A0AAW1EPB6_ZOAVI